MTDIPEVIPSSAVVERRPAAGPHRWAYDDTIAVLDAAHVLDAARSEAVHSSRLALGDAPTTAAGDPVYAFCPVCGEPVTEVTAYDWDPPPIVGDWAGVPSPPRPIGVVFAPCHHAANRYVWALTVDDPRAPADAAT